MDFLRFYMLRVLGGSGVLGWGVGVGRMQEQVQNMGHEMGTGFL